MEFTEAEIKFLCEPRAIECADSSRTTVLPSQRDLRLIGCPERIFNRLLERRAAKLGTKFLEFRARNGGHSAAPITHAKEQLEVADDARRFQAKVLMDSAAADLAKA